MDSNEARSVGVNYTKREEFLSEEDFQTAFGMDKHQYSSTPPWKKEKLKRAALLF